MNWLDYLYYDESSPSFLRWKIEVRSGKKYKRINRKIGDIAGTLVHGYYRVTINKKHSYNHIIIWEINKGKSLLNIDHIDGNPLNNNIANLREVTQAMNSRNAKMYVNNTSGVTGVYISVMGSIKYWTGFYRDHCRNKPVSKHFSVKKLGEEEAFRQACEFRRKGIEYNNSTGAGYTDRHGTPETQHTQTQC